TEPFDLAGRGRAIFSLVAGSASAADVGYVVARPYSTLPTPFAIFDRAKKEDVSELPKLGLTLGLLGLFLAAMAIMYFERDRPLAIFRSQIDKIAAGQADELDLAHLIRQHRMLGESIHRAIDAMVAKGGGTRQKPKANLDEILGPAPENLASSAFSFGENKGTSGSGTFQPAALPPPTASGRPMPPPMPPPKAAGVPAPKPGAQDDEKSVALKFDALPVPGQRANGSPAYLSADEEAHFREVFSKFVAMRQQCGERTEDLTYERFLGTLQKHRDQILQSRPDAKGVKFTVYAKEGKAALKAAPRKA
ncbi:MAG TPA: MXAN_5187 C-terminal domain-containing protein, partial [Polyangiaceae bacterium]|nr:MXAN_5187 C-terminal domain-containing protein [Polyangiaceae bacterium]